MPGRRAKSRAIGPWVDLHDLPPVPRNKKKKPKNRKRIHPSFRVPLALGLMPSKARQTDPLGLNLRTNDNMHIMEGDCDKSSGVLTAERAPDLLPRASKSDDSKSLLEVNVNIDVPEAAVIAKIDEKETEDEKKENEEVVKEPSEEKEEIVKDQESEESPACEAAVSLTNGEHSAEPQPDEEIEEIEKETSESEDNLRIEDDVEKEEEEEDGELEAMEAAEAESIQKAELAEKASEELLEEIDAKEEDELDNSGPGSPSPEALEPQIVVKIEKTPLESHDDCKLPSPSELAMSLAKPASPCGGSKNGSRSASPLSQPSSPKRLCAILTAGKAVSSRGETATLWAKPPSPPKAASPACGSKSPTAPAGVTAKATPIVKEEPQPLGDLDLRTNVSTISITTPNETLLRKRSVEKEGDGEFSSGSESDTGRKRVRVDHGSGHTSPFHPPESQMAGNYMDYERERLIQDFVADCSQRPEELNRAVDKLQKELETLAELLKAKELEWNTLLRLKKLKEETLERLKRKKRQTAFDETSSERFLDHATLRNALKPHGNNQLMMVPIVSSSPTSMLNRAPPPIRMPDYSSHQKAQQQRPILPKPYGNVVDPSTIMREGRNGPVLDVKSIIADYSAPYRSRHPQDIPRRGRRVRGEHGPRSNAVNPSSLISMSNMALGSGARVRTVTDSPYMLPNPEQLVRAAIASSDARGDSSGSYKDVLAQFAKLTGGANNQANLASAAGNAANMNPSSKNSHPPSGLPPPPYPEVTLHPVGGGGRIPSPPVSTSLLHGILTKNVPTSRPSNFSPTLARLLTAPDRPPAAAHQSMVVHPPPPPYRPQQQSSSSRVPTISDIINSSKKSRNEITITPVPGNQPPQKIPKEEAPTPDEDDGEGDRLVIDESADDSPLQCQGCKQRSAQFVCAGCGNQWYCSRECQVTAWEEHSDVCSG